MSLYTDYQPTNLTSLMSLPELEANVTRIDTEIAQLKAERLKVYKSWRMRKASIAPFTRLPIEIIRQIFLECSDTVTANYIQHGNRLPLRLLRVCRSWERIAASIERLWTEMHIDVGSTNAMPILASCLKRSGKLPLDITLRVSAEYPDEDEMEQKARSC
ncbi:hypothetical protein FIBSPDRAFT_968007 [Athelia psychrophila]|uniref:F-box domain-containing protein n=1 Tax=Athelia psychrophila TaxID=1759441 RepID=A0A167V348_9AGAM|nr:hypothetical protein FIBSPDRAFT_968007 [Fibularhizoctonia sp. CBS 109695]